MTPGPLQPLEECLWRPETRFDRALVDRLFAPDLVEFGRSGRVYSRADLLAVPPQPFTARLPCRVSRRVPCRRTWSS
ncbi:DUF4440 domain-containing protein [Sagittula sp. S175]|uniref:DUF4440 domain-containing protein n=1 Tax=Sagittula sp. S175 TaxID=3415129 RepID=UPI003C7B4A4C